MDTTPVDRWCKVISVLQIGGGVTAIAMTGWLLSGMQITGALVLLFVPFVVVFMLAILAGVALWKGWRAGLWLSLFVQAVQLPRFSTAAFDYELALGLKLTGGIFGSGVRFWWNVGADFDLSVPGGDGPLGVGLNVAAVVCIVHLARHIPDLLEKRGHSLTTLSVQPQRPAESARHGDGGEGR